MSDPIKRTESETIRIILNDANGIIKNIADHRAGIRDPRNDKPRGGEHDILSDIKTIAERVRLACEMRRAQGEVTLLPDTEYDDCDGICWRGFETPMGFVLLRDEYDKLLGKGEKP